jgi:DNA mismatch repair protein MutL
VSPPPAEERQERKPPAQGSFKVREDKLLIRQNGVEYNGNGPERVIVTHRVPVLEPVAPPHEIYKEWAREEKDPPPAEAEEPASLLPEPSLPDYRIIGECFTEYILVESGETLIFVDKHAVHERMLFDKLKAREDETMSQLLLAPVIVEMRQEDMLLLLDNGALLEELGFELVNFGLGAISVRRIPADVDVGDVAPLLEELCRDLRYGARPGGLGVKDEMLATVACKAAIKAGSASAPEEWKPVVEAALSGAVKYCPHGRPVTMRLEKSKLDKNFKRT